MIIINKDANVTKMTVCVGVYNYIAAGGRVSEMRQTIEMRTCSDGTILPLWRTLEDSMFQVEINDMIRIC
jgi:hypothetical protein